MIKKIFFSELKKKNKVFIIAEIGSGHLGKIGRAFKLIDIASKAGVDAIKFQTFKAEEMATLNTKYNRIEKHPYNLFSRWKDLEFPFKYYKKVINYCKKKKIIFMTSVFGTESLNFTNKFNSIIKITSFDLNYFELLDEAIKSKKPILVSTGISNEKMIKKLINFFKDKKFKNYAIMHCGSSYPLRFEDANLNYIKKLNKKFPNNPVGYSDHTQNISSSIAAVALGAKIIEKHITISQKDKFPDAFFSLEFKNLDLMVRNIRELEKSLGEEKKIISKSIMQNKKAMRSYYAVNFIKKNTIIKKGMFKALRPRVPGSIEIHEFHNFLNKKLNRNIEKYDILKKKYINF